MVYISLVSFDCEGLSSDVRPGLTDAPAIAVMMRELWSVESKVTALYIPGHHASMLHVDPMPSPLVHGLHCCRACMGNSTNPWYH